MRCSTRLKILAAGAALPLCVAIITPQVALAQRKGGRLRSPEVEVSAPRGGELRREEVPPAARLGGVEETAAGAASDGGAASAASPVRAAGRDAAPSTLTHDGVRPGKYNWRRVPTPSVLAAVPPLVISEFRLNGTNGANDEFVEIYNNSDAAVTVSAPASTGYALAASDGIVRFIIPNGIIIPARGHFLGCNTVGYSLTSLPAGNGTTATCDAMYTTNISNGEDPDGAGGNPPLPRQGIALFNNANPGLFNLANRLDAVGPTGELNTLYKEGTGVRNLSHFSTAHSYVRRLPGGCIGTNPSTVDANCTSEALIGATAIPSSGFSQDTDNNRNDFIFVDTNGTSQSPEGTQQRLGAPGPENRSSPVVRMAPNGMGAIYASPFDPCVANSAAPNRLRDLTNDPTEPNDTFGSMYIRKKFTNNSGVSVTRLRFRIVDLTTFPASVFTLPMGTTCGDPSTSCAADLRALSSTSIVATTSAPCGSVTKQALGLTLEQAASFENQPNGGAFNSTLSTGAVTLAQPLPPNATLIFNFRFGVQQRGSFRALIIVEALP